MSEEQITSPEVSREAPEIEDQNADAGEELEAAGEPTAEAEAQPEDVSEGEKPLGRTGKYIKKLEREREEAQQKLDEALEEAGNWRSELQRVLRQGQQPEAPKVEVDMSDLPKPRRDDFDDPDEYEEARNFWIAIKATRTEAARTQQRNMAAQFQEMEAKKLSWGAEGRKKYPDFDVAYGVPVTNEMRDELFASEFGHDVAYFLGKNPVEAARIAQLLPVEQKYEIRKLAKREATKKKPKSETTAPSPTSPVGDRETIAKEWKITDPDIPYKEYEKLRMKQERVRLGLT